MRVFRSKSNPMGIWEFMAKFGVKKGLFGEIRGMRYSKELRRWSDKSGWRGGRAYELDPWIMPGDELRALTVITDAESN